jgi:putative transposase
LKEARELIGKDRVLRLMQEANIKAQRGYRAPRHHANVAEHPVAGNLLKREFEVEEPNRWWVSDITYIRTYEGFMFVAVVMDLFARNIVG